VKLPKANRNLLARCCRKLLLGNHSLLSLSSCIFPFFDQNVGAAFNNADRACDDRKGIGLLIYGQQRAMRPPLTRLSFHPLHVWTASNSTNQVKRIKLREFAFSDTRRPMIRKT